MKYIVNFSSQALEDITELLDYIFEKAGERIARNYVDRLIDHCARFETFPEQGTLREDISPGLRLVGYHRKATIALRVKGDCVTILRIFHGGRNVVFLPEGEDDQD